MVRFRRVIVWSFPVVVVLLTMITFNAFMSKHNMRLKYVQIPEWTETKAEVRNVIQNKTLTAPPPKVHLGFLKVHKAASTTTQTIFLRFGWRRNLTFVLPPEYNAFGYPNIISLNESMTKYNTLSPPPGKEFDILCHHVVYGQEAWSSRLPSDTAIVGTVREPFKLFKSTLNYFQPRYIKRIVSNDQIGEYLANFMKYEPVSMSASFTNNRLAFEYGVTLDIIRNKDFTAFNDYLQNVLNKTFDVVILGERFDESLVLMKRKLNWDLNDIMYALKNVRSEKKPDAFKVEEKHRALHKEASPFDYLLYEFFEKRLQQQIEAEGPSFQEEVKHFQELRKYIENFCHAVPRSVKSVKLNKGQWNDEFEISRNDCDILHKGEISFTQEIRKRQYGSATWPNRPSKQ